MSASLGQGDRQVGLVGLWRCGGLSLWKLVTRAFQGYRIHQLDARSAQFAYYSVLALAPLLIVIIAGVAHLPLEGVLESFLDAVDVGMPRNVVQLLERQVLDIQARTSVELIVLGMLLLGLAGSHIFLTLGAGLDASFGVQQPRRFWKSSGVALVMTLAAFLLLLVSMILLVVGPWLGDLITHNVHALPLETPWIQVLLSSGMRWGIACSFMLAATSIIYWLIPSLKLPWYLVSPGSLFATAGWVAATQGFRIYVESFGRYNETYGALGGVVVLMIWLYLTGALLLMGGQINAVIHQAVREQQLTATSLAPSGPSPAE